MRGFLVFFLCIVFRLSATAQCAGFQLFADDSVGCPNAVKTFRIHPKLPVGVQANWDFDFKTVANNSSPSVAFLQSGSYTVSVECVFPTSTCVIERKNYIKIGANPKINKVSLANPTICNIHTKQKITADVTNAKLLTWSIDGSLYKGNAQSINHRFSKTGQIQLSLIAESNEGCKEKKIIDSIAFVERKPTVRFPFEDTLLCGLSILDFKPKYTYYGGQKSFDYNWILPGATPNQVTTAQTGNVIYTNENKTHDVRLILNSKVSNCQYSYLWPDKVEVKKAPNLSIKAEALNGDGCKSKIYGIKVLTTGLDTNKITWTHSHGDSLKFSKFSGDSIIVKSDYNGTFNVQVSYPFANCIKHVSLRINLSSNDLLAEMERNIPCICKLPYPLLITNKSVHNNGKNLTFDWKLVNQKGEIQQTAIDTNFTPTITEYGDYSIRLKASDEDGCFEQASYEIKAKPFKIEIETSPKVSCPNTEVTLKLQDTLCMEGVDSIWWTLYNIDKSLRANITTLEALETYTDTGWYGIKVIIKTVNGCTDTLKRDRALKIVDLKSVTGRLLSDTFCMGDEIFSTFSVKPRELVGEWFGEIISPDTLFKATVLQDTMRFLPTIPGVYDLKMRFVADNCHDSVYLKSVVRAGGVKFDFSAQISSGCLPFSSPMKTSIESNTLTGTSDPTLRYEWSLIPPESGSFDFDSIKNPAITITKNGALGISLKTTNAQGCENTLVKQGLFNFDLISEFSLPDTFCSGLKLPVASTSTGDIDSLLWTVSDATIQILPDDTSQEVDLIFTEAGDYEIGLILRDKGGCIDSFYQKIFISNFNYSYSIDDTSAKCSPADFVFEAQGDDIDTIYWDFGDGTGEIRTTLSEYLKIYDLQRITPYKNEFDVKLRVLNKYGCQDSIVLKKYVTVRGPVPYFEIDDLKGCQPYEVNFTHYTSHASNVYFDYGDNTSIDSVNYQRHTYFLGDSVEYEVFKPFLIAEDDHGCNLSFTPKDSIIIYSMPKAWFFVSKNPSCSGDSVVFQNTSVYAYEWSWYFGDGDTLIDSLSRTVHVYDSAGLYKPWLVVKNAINCADTFALEIDLPVYQSPTARMILDDSFSCPDIPLIFRDSTTSPFLITSWLWDFGDSMRTTDTSSLINPSYKYLQPGNYLVKLLVVDSNSCRDSVYSSELIKIRDSLDIIKPSIRFLTVVDDNSLRLHLDTSEKHGFKRYVFSETNELFLPVFSPKRRQRQWYLNGLFTDSLRYCVKLSVEDKCGFIHPADTHCAVLLSIDRSSESEAKLSWTAYEGWGRGRTYYMLTKVEKNQTDTLRIRLAPGQFDYLDKAVCDLDYLYSIEARPTNSSLLSLSNDQLFHPEYVFQIDPLQIRYATVDDSFIRVQWDSSIQRNINLYIIERKAAGKEWLKDWKRTENTFLLDRKAKFMSAYYTYRVRALDECHYESDQSNPATSILLQGVMVDQKVNLSWNTYRQWSSGVSMYELERKSLDELNWNLLATFSPLDSNFIDSGAFYEYSDSFYYRIKAIENATEPDTSISNLRLVLPESTLFIPNAFSPNGDGLNDVFEIKSTAMRRDSVGLNAYKLLIYNRWGQEVFRSNTLGEHWNGSLKGEICPVGQYLYLIQGQAIDGTIFYQDGFVMIVK